MFLLQEAIMNMTDKICSFLPQQYADQCHSYLKEYGPIVISLLKNGDPKTLCAFAQLCSAAKTHTASHIVPKGNAHVFLRF